jgi:hypothetical protein
MKAGFHGSANVVCPSLLPLLSKIPDDAIGPGSAFYSEFFGNMKNRYVIDLFIYKRFKNGKEPPTVDTASRKPLY